MNFDIPPEMPRKSPSVVLVGRPNVGKSTLFNRMTGRRRAIVAPIAGTTRDALARPVDWQRRPRSQLFDTGGLFGASEDPLHALVVEHGQRAIAGADLLVFARRRTRRAGPRRRARSPRELRETGPPVLLAINKTDDKPLAGAALEFYQLGFDPVFEISAEHGTGVAELLDEIVERAGAEADDVRGASGREDGPGDSDGRAEPKAAASASRQRDARRDRRPPERRQVVAGQSAAA